MGKKKRNNDNITCEQCEISYTDRKNIKEYIQALETKLKKYELQTIPYLEGELEVLKKALKT